MNKLRHGRLLHDAFRAGIIAKGIDGVFEVIGGFLLLLARPSTIGRFVQLLTQHELSRHPDDIVAQYLLTSARHLTEGAKLFGSAYLLSHGFTKVLLVAALWTGRFRAYPAAIVFFLIFILYQLYRYSLTRSVWLLLLSAFDAFVVFLVCAEYRRIREDVRQSHLTV